MTQLLQHICSSVRRSKTYPEMCLATHSQWQATVSKQGQQESEQHMREVSTIACMLGK